MRPYYRVNNLTLNAASPGAPVLARRGTTQFDKHQHHGATARLSAAHSQLNCTTTLGAIRQP